MIFSYHRWQYSQAGSFGGGGITPGTVVETITGNAGGAVGPDGSSNVNIVGSGNITVTGNAGTHTLTITESGAVADSFPTDSGTATPSSGVLDINAGNSAQLCGSSVEFTGSGHLVQLNVTDANGNVIIGEAAGNASISGENNVSIGVNSLGSLTSGSYNVGVGYNALVGALTAANNVALGWSALANAGSSAFNTALGTDSLYYLTSGSYNIAAGDNSGINYTGSESSNILLNHEGVIAESNVLRIGAATGSGNQQLAKAYICGIAGVDVASTATVVTEHSDQLGTAVITAGTGITVTPGANTITIAVSGSGVGETITGDSGGALSPTAGNWTFTGGTTGLTFAGAVSTETLGGTLKLANGGTNANLTASNGGIFYSTATAGAILAGTVTANQVLLSGSSTTPAWSTATYPATTTINQLLYSSANNVIGGVTAGDYGVLISSSTGVPEWLANGTTGQILTATTAGTPSWENVAASSITITGDSGGGLTGSSFTFTGGTTGLTFAGAGSTETLGGTLIVANGGTDANSFNTNGVVISGTSSTAKLTALSLTSGQVVIGGTSTPAAATLTAGTGISIANGNNTITISASSSGFSWTDATAASYTVAAENGYVADRGTLVTFTLPTNNSLGDTIKIVGKGAGGWTIVYGSNQNIIFGASTTTTTTGNLSSTNAGDCVELVCTTASITSPIFTVVSSVGNLTVV
jgi:hypothetical protein